MNLLTLYFKATDYALTVWAQGDKNCNQWNRDFHQIDVTLWLDGEVVEEYTTSRANESEVKAFVESCFSNLADKYSLVRDNKESIIGDDEDPLEDWVEEFAGKLYYLWQDAAAVGGKTEATLVADVESEKKFSVKVIPEFDKTLTVQRRPFDRSFNTKEERNQWVKENGYRLTEGDMDDEKIIVQEHQVQERRREKGVLFSC